MQARFLLLDFTARQTTTYCYRYYNYLHPRTYVILPDVSPGGSPSIA